MEKPVVSQTAHYTVKDFKSSYKADLVSNFNGFGKLREKKPYFHEFNTDFVGLISKNGDCIIPLESKCDTDINIDSKIVSVADDKGWSSPVDGFYDLEGRRMFDYQYATLQPFSDGIAFIRTKDEEALEKVGAQALLISDKGEIVLTLPYVFCQIAGFGDVVGYSYAANCGSYKEGLIPFDCQYKFKKTAFEYDGVPEEKREWSERNAECGYMDLQGNIVISQQFSGCWPFSDGMAKVATVSEDRPWEYDRFGYIDKTGKLVIPYRFKDAYDFHNGYAVVSDGKKYGVINKSGAFVIPCAYDTVSGYRDGYFVVSNGKKYGVLDAEGKQAVPLQYDDLYTGDNGTFVYRAGKVIELRTMDGEVLWKTTADECSDYSNYYNGVLYYIADGTIHIVTVEEKVPRGDVSGDGKVTAEDARLALRAAVGLEEYAKGSAEFLAADADKNGELTAADARLILRAAVGLETLS